MTPEPLIIVGSQDAPGCEDGQCAIDPDADVSELTS